MEMIFADLRKFFRYLAAILLLTAPFMAMPLAFGRLGGLPVPLFGLVQCVTMPVMTLLAMAVIAAFPEELLPLWHNRKLKFLLLSAGAYTLVLCWQLLIARITGEEFLGGMFFVVMPLAAAALNRELRRILPFFAATGALLIYWSGCTSENFTGLLGNWNWSCGLLTALIPAIFLAGKYQHWQRWSLIVLTVFFAASFCISPERFPRSALLAAAVATGIIFLREKMPERKFSKALIAVTAAVTGIFFIFISSYDLPDTRFQIWRGALDSLLHEPLTGAGSGHFSEIIRANLYESFYFTEFAAGHIDHAHNDLLNIFTECGIFGAIFYFAALLTLLPVRTKNDHDKLAKWIFAVMLVCGCFDQHNITVPGASFTALAAGILLIPAKRFAPPPLPAGSYTALQTFAGIVLFLCAFNMAEINWRATRFIRQGDMMLLRGDINGALQKYASSMRKKVTRHALYQSAEIYLLKQQPQCTMDMIAKMEKDLHISNYRHTQRFQAIAALQTGNPALAIAAWEKEMLNAPYSVINAHFQCFLVRTAGMDSTVIQAADQHFLELCQMRNLDPQDIQRDFTPEMDDAAFPPEIREAYFQK